MTLTRFVCRFLVSLFCIMSSSAVSYAQLNEDLHRRNQAFFIKTRFNLFKFDEIEALHRRYLTEKTRTPSGVWELTQFHEGLQIKITDRAGQPLIDDKPYAPFFDTWFAEYPDSEAAHLMRARIPLTKINAILENASGHQLTGNERRLIGENLTLAAAYVRKHRPAKPMDPTWNVVAIRLAAWQGMDRASFNWLLEQSVEQHPTHQQTYFEALFYYANHSDDGHADVERLARMAIEKSKSEEGEGLYARIYWSAIASFGYDIIDAADWPTMRRAMEDVVKLYPDNRNLEWFGRFACQRNDRSTAWRMLDRLKWEKVGPYWKKSEIERDCQAWAMAGVNGGR